MLGQDWTVLLSKKRGKKRWKKEQERRKELAGRRLDPRKGNY